MNNRFNYYDLVYSFVKIKILEQNYINHCCAMSRTLLDFIYNLFFPVLCIYKINSSTSFKTTKKNLVRSSRRLNWYVLTHRGSMCYAFC